MAAWTVRESLRTYESLVLVILVGSLIPRVKLAVRAAITLCLSKTWLGQILTRAWSLIAASENFNMATLESSPAAAFCGRMHSMTLRITPCIIGFSPVTTIRDRVAFRAWRPAYPD